MARFGQWNIESNVQPLPTQEAKVLAIITHPSYYSGGLFHDVAVLILEKPVTYNANILPICLPEQGMIFAANIRCYGIGWGSNSFGKSRVIDLWILVIFFSRFKRNANNDAHIHIRI